VNSNCASVPPVPHSVVLYSISRAVEDTTYGWSIPIEHMTPYRRRIGLDVGANAA